MKTLEMISLLIVGAALGQYLELSLYMIRDSMRKRKYEKARDAAKKAADQRKEDLKKIQEVEKEYALQGESLKQQEIIAETQKYSDLIKLANKYGYGYGTNFYITFHLL